MATKPKTGKPKTAFEMPGLGVWEREGETEAQRNERARRARDIVQQLASLRYDLPKVARRLEQATKAQKKAENERARMQAKADELFAELERVKR